MNFTPFGGFTVEPTPAPPAACVGEKEVRGAFSRTGFLYTLLLLLHLGVAYGVFFLLRLIAPAFAANPNAVFFYDSLPFYLLVVPVIFLAMKKFGKFARVADVFARYGLGYPVAEGEFVRGVLEELGIIRCENGIRFVDPDVKAELTKSELYRAVSAALCQGR